MKPRAYAVHRLPGRVRFKIPSHRHRRRFFEELEQRLRRLDAVTDVKTNPATGSVLVEHKGEIADFAKDAFGSGLGELIELALGSPPVARRLHAEVVSLDKTVQAVTGGEIDLGTLASMGLLALGAFQLWRGQPATAVTLGWYATELLRRSGGGEPHGNSAHGG
jgi:hypothetical protein